MHLRRGALIAVLVPLAGPVLADAVLPIGGAFGNEAGCAFFMSGDNSDDRLVILTPDTFSTYAIGCYFETLVSGAAGDYVLTASCANEGDDKVLSDTVAVQGSMSSGYTVSIGDSGPDWGPLPACPGTEGLFELQGTPV